MALQHDKGGRREGEREHSKKGGAPEGQSRRLLRTREETLFFLAFFLLTGFTRKQKRKNASQK